MGRMIRSSGHIPRNEREAKNHGQKDQAIFLSSIFLSGVSVPTTQAVLARTTDARDGRFDTPQGPNMRSIMRPPAFSCIFLHHRRIVSIPLSGYDLRLNF